MPESNELVRSTREALRAILELTRELRELEKPTMQNWSYAKDGRSYSLSPARALDEAEAYALHFLHSKLLTHGEIAETAARLLSPFVSGVRQALEAARRCLEVGSSTPRWNYCGQEFVRQIGPHLVDLRENLPIALLKSPPIEEFEEAARSLKGLVKYLEELKNQATELAKEAEEAAKKVQDLKEEASAATETTKTLKEKTETAFNKINEILKEAKSLEEDIEKFKAEFDALSKDHEALLDQLKERENELALLLTSAHEQQEKIREILDAAKEALGWAQASGLAGASYESWERYQHDLTAKGRALAAVIALLAIATTAYLMFAPGWIARFLADLSQAGIEPNAYVTWFIKVLSFVPLLVLGYGVWTMSVDYAVLRNLAHSYRHREVLARTLQAFRELVSEEESAEITKQAFQLFLQDPMARAYKGLSPLQRATGELRTLAGEARARVDIEGSGEGRG